MADTSLNENRTILLIWQISNIWQSKIRRLLNDKNLNFNEYIILETVFKLSNLNNFEFITQQEISKQSYIDSAVISSKISILQNKGLIKKNSSYDNRSNNITMTSKGRSLIISLIPIIDNNEELLFNKLGFENNNFLNSLKLLLGKKIRIKAK